MTGKPAWRNTPAEAATAVPRGQRSVSYERVERGLGQALDRAAALFGARTAVVDGDRRLTYAQLAGRVAGLGGGLRELGVAPGGVVAVLALNSLEHLECWLGIPRCGAVLNDLNFRLAPAELEFVLADCGAVALIADDAFAELGAALAGRCDSVRHLIHCGRDEGPGGAIGYADLLGGDPAPDAGAGDQLAGIFYTGGTTGLPRVSCSRTPTWSRTPGTC